MYYKMLTDNNKKQANPQFKEQLAKLESDLSEKFPDLFRK